MIVLYPKEEDDLCQDFTAQEPLALASGGSAASCGIRIPIGTMEKPAMFPANPLQRAAPGGEIETARGADRHAAHALFPCNRFLEINLSTRSSLTANRSGR